MYVYIGVDLAALLSKLQVSFAKEPYKRDSILQKRPIIALEYGKVSQLLHFVYPKCREEYMKIFMYIYM